MFKKVEFGCGYDASDSGEVFSCNMNKLLKQETTKNGYKRVNLYCNGKRKRFLVHRLVWETFVGKIPEGYELDHIDGNPQNNRLENLRVVTHKENQNNPVTYAKIVYMNRKHANDIEWRNKLSARWNNPEFREKMNRIRSSKEFRDKMRDAKNQQVYQMTKNGEIVKLWNSSKEASKELSINKGNIASCCTGKRKTAGGFVWRKTK